MMTTKHAIVEALKAPTGAIPNGPDLPTVTGLKRQGGRFWACGCPRGSARCGVTPAGAGGPSGA
jgi:hypothetical protein